MPVRFDLPERPSTAASTVTATAGAGLTLDAFTGPPAVGY